MNNDTAITLVGIGCVGIGWILGCWSGSDYRRALHGILSKSQADLSATEKELEIARSAVRACESANRWLRKRTEADPFYNLVLTRDCKVVHTGRGRVQVSFGEQRLRGMDKVRVLVFSDQEYCPFENRMVRSLAAEGGETSTSQVLECGTCDVCGAPDGLCGGDHEDPEHYSARMGDR